jgi:hypothetical protein
LYNIFPICVVSCRIWISESHNIFYLFQKKGFISGALKLSLLLIRNETLFCVNEIER